MYLSTAATELATDFYQSFVSNWIDIPNHKDYQIDLLAGDIRNRHTGKIIKTCLHQGSSRIYEKCSLGLIHRLLMSATLGRALVSGELVCHVDGDGCNNNIENLRVGTAKLNSLDKISSNTNGRKLKNQDIRDIRALSKYGWSPAKIAKRFNVTCGHIRGIVKGRHWRNLT